MNLPNILTLSRIVLAVVLVVVLQQGTWIGNILAVIVFGTASLTDFCDGYLAKSRGLVSNFGKIMDPVADKVLILSAFGVLTHINMVDWWMFAVIAIREIGVTISRLMALQKGQVQAAEQAGKIKTVSQIVAISAMLLYLAAQQTQWCSFWFYNAQHAWLNVDYILNLIAVILTVYSGIGYFRHDKYSN